jgi:hypothetical protein
MVLVATVVLILLPPLEVTPKSGRVIPTAGNTTADCIPVELIAAPSALRLLRFLALASKRDRLWSGFPTRGFPIVRPL